MGFRILLAVLITLGYMTARSQPDGLRFDNLSTRDGLSDNKVVKVVQDDLGFIWIATHNGLNRFDGYRYKVFLPQSNNPNSLLSPELKDLYYDSIHNVLWIAYSGGGVSTYDLVNGSFRHFQYDVSNPHSISGNHLTCFTVDKQSQVWLGTTSGLNRFDPATQTFTRFMNTGTEPYENYIAAMSTDHFGNLWVRTKTELHCIQNGSDSHVTVSALKEDRASNNTYEPKPVLVDRENFLWTGIGGTLVRSVAPIGTETDPLHLQFVTYNMPNREAYHIYSNEVRCLFESTAGDLWVGTIKGVYVLRQEHKQSNIFESYLYERKFLKADGLHLIRFIHEDRTGHIWVASDYSDNGLFRLHAEKKEYNQIQHNTLEPDGLASNQVFNVFDDRSGALWFATTDGVSRLQVLQYPFRTLKHQPGHAISLNANAVFSIYQGSDSILWIGTTQGINVYDRKKNTIRYLERDRQSVERPQGKIVGCFEPAKNFLWIGYLDFKVSQYFTAASHFKHYTSQEDTFRPYSIRDIHTALDGSIWFAGIEPAMARYNPQDQSFSNFDLACAPDQGQAQNWAWSFFEDSAGTLWVTSKGCGVVKLNNNGYPFEYMLNKKTGLPVNDIRCMTEYPAGTFWLGSYGAGLIRVEMKNDQNVVTVFNDQHGLTSNIVNGILSEDNGRLWLSTSKGLFRFDIQTGIFRQFTQNEGISGNEFNEGAYFKSKGGEFFFGSMEGLTYFRPSEIVDKPFNATTTLTQLSVSNNPVHSGDTIQGEVVLTKDISRTQTITLSHRQNDFSLEFAVVNSPNPSVVYYAYKLDNYDNRWKYTQTDRKATYTELPPGEYYFHVKATVDHNRWGDTTTSLRVVILPPWWKQPWFRISGITVLTLILITLYKVRTAGLLKQQIKLEEMISNRTAELIEKNKRIAEQVSTIESLNLVGQHITASLHITEIIGKLYHIINDFMDVPSFSVGWIKEKEGTIEFWGYSNPNALITAETVNLNNLERLSVWCVNNREVVFMNNVDAEIHRYFHKSVSGYTAESTPKSCIYLPLFSKQNNVIGILVAKSYKINSYSNTHLSVLKSLASYISIALDNARVYQELQRMDEMKTNFFYNVSHELRTPLTLLLGPLEELQSFPNKQSHNIELMKRNGERLMNLINQLLDSQKIQEGMMELRCAKIDMVVFIRGIIHLFDAQAAKLRIQISFVSAEEIMFAEIDKDKIEKVFFNLISNALKFTPDGGSIKLFLERATINDRKGIRIVVEDTGSGIPLSSLHYVFNRFYQASEHQDRPNTSGLGLSLTRELIELHGGTINVESQPEMGTRFSIELPQDQIISPIPQNLEAAIEEVNAADLQSQKPIVLLADDYSDFRLYVCESFSENYVVHQAANGQEAFEKAVSITPDIIISDIMMPVVNGIQLCEQLKLDKRTSHIPIILLTARSGDESQIKGLETGADDYILKPFKMAMLKARVNNLINGRKHLHALFKGIEVPSTQTIATNERDKEFLDQFYEVINQHMAQEDLSHELLSKHLGFSKSGLYRKVTALTGKSVHDIIRTLRLTKAHELLLTTDLKVFEVAYETGFKSQSVFSRAFQQHFGISATNLKANQQSR